MATITATASGVPVDSFVGNSRLVTWTPLANGDSGSAVSLSEFTDRSAAVTGTFGAGGTLIIEGTIDGTNWFTLTDPQGNNLSFTSARLEAISEATVQIRPRVTAGDGTTALTVTMLAHRGNVG